MNLPLGLVVLLFSALLLAQTPQRKAPSKVTTKQKQKPPQVHSDFGVHTLTDAVELPSADIDCDGKPDRVVMGTTEITRRYFIGGKYERHKHRVVVFGLPDKRQKNNAVTIHFLKDTGYYGFCAVPPKEAAEVKPLTCEWEGDMLSDCDPKRKCQAIALKDACVDMMLLWNPRLERLSWVRKASSQ